MQKITNGLKKKNEYIIKNKMEEHFDELTKRYMKNLCLEIVRVIRLSDMLEDDGFTPEEHAIMRAFCAYDENGIQKISDQSVKEQVEKLKIRFACMKGLLSEEQAEEFFN